MQEQTEGSTPLDHRDAVERWGPALPVHHARYQWCELVAHAEAGRVTLIEQEPALGAWVALVPVSEVAVPLAGLQVWRLDGAQAALQTLVVRAGRHDHPESHLIVDGHRPVAAIVNANALEPRPYGTERLDLAQALRTGKTLTVRCNPWTGSSGQGLDGDRLIYELDVARKDGVHVGSGICRTLEGISASVWAMPIGGPEDRALGTNQDRLEH